MTTPFDIVECSVCGTHIYAGASSCYECGEPSEWKKALASQEDAQASDNTQKDTQEGRV